MLFICSTVPVLLISYSQQSKCLWPVFVRTYFHQTMSEQKMWSQSHWRQFSVLFHSRHRIIGFCILTSSRRQSHISYPCEVSAIHTSRADHTLFGRHSSPWIFETIDPTVEIVWPAECGVLKAAAVLASRCRDTKHEDLLLIRPGSQFRGQA